MTYTCKCGKTTFKSPIGARPCHSCEHCGSALASRPGLHKPVRPHKLVKMTVATDKGNRVLTVCQWCRQSRAEILVSGGSVQE